MHPILPKKIENNIIVPDLLHVEAIISAGNDIRVHIRLLITVEVPVTNQETLTEVSDLGLAARNDNSQEAGQHRILDGLTLREVDLDPSQEADQVRVPDGLSCREDHSQDHKGETTLVSDRDLEIGSFHKTGIIFRSGAGTAIKLDIFGGNAGHFKIIHSIRQEMMLNISTTPDRMTCVQELITRVSMVHT